MQEKPLKDGEHRPQGSIVFTDPAKHSSQVRATNVGPSWVECLSLYPDLAGEVNTFKSDPDVEPIHFTFPKEYCGGIHEEDFDKIKVLLGSQFLGIYMELEQSINRCPCRLVFCSPSTLKSAWSEGMMCPITLRRSLFGDELEDQKMPLLRFTPDFLDTASGDNGVRICIDLESVPLLSIVYSSVRIKSLSLYATTSRPVDDGWASQAAQLTYLLRSNVHFTNDEIYHFLELASSPAATWFEFAKPITRQMTVCDTFEVSLDALVDLRQDLDDAHLAFPVEGLLLYGDFSSAEQLSTLQWLFRSEVVDDSTHVKSLYALELRKMSKRGVLALAELLRASPPLLKELHVEADENDPFSVSDITTLIDAASGLTRLVILGNNFSNDMMKVILQRQRNLPHLEIEINEHFPEFKGIHRECPACQSIFLEPIECVVGGDTTRRPMLQFSRFEAVVIPDIDTFCKFSLLAQKLTAEPPGNKLLDKSSEDRILHMNLENSVSGKSVQAALVFICRIITENDHALAVECDTEPYMPTHHLHFYRRYIAEGAHSGYEVSSRHFLLLVGELVEIATFLEVPALKLFVRTLLLRAVVKGGLDDCIAPRPSSDD